jgi:ABC-type amino acid transport substrate-binding protein
MRFVEAFKLLQFLALILDSGAIGYLEDEHNELASEVALSIQNQSSTRCQTTTIIWNCQSTKQNDFLEEVLKVVFNKSSSAVEVRGFIESSPKTCLVFLVEASEEFLTRLQNSRKHLNHLSSYLIVIVNEKSDGISNGIDRIFEELWSRNIHKVVAVYEKASSVEAFTFDPFDGESGTAKPVKIFNAFSSSNLRNLKLRPVRIVAPRIELFVTKNKDNEIVGRDIEIVKALSKALNFKMELEYLDYPFSFGNVLENGTATGALKHLIDGKADVAIGDYYMTFSRLKYIDASKSYTSLKLSFVVPPGRNFEPIEKLLKPFSIQIWLVLLFLAIFWVLSAALLNKFHIKVSFLDVFAVFLAVSIPKSSPRRISTRIFFMTVVMSVLVLQAAYQGLLFKLLQSNGRMKTVETLKELAEQDFKIYVVDSQRSLFEGYSNLQKK